MDLYATDLCDPGEGNLRDWRMRHGKAFRKLSRNPLKRGRLLNQLATHLFEHEQIQTTMARAKELRRVSDQVFHGVES